MDSDTKLPIIIIDPLNIVCDGYDINIAFSTSAPVSLDIALLIEYIYKNIYILSFLSSYSSYVIYRTVLCNINLVL